MKELPYFQFTAKAWLSGNISLFDMVHQGVFINLCALIWDNGGEYEIEPLLHLRLRLPKDDLFQIIADLCDANLLEREGDILRVKFLTEQLQEYLQYLAEKQAAGRKGAAKRWQSIANKQNRTKQNGKNNKGNKVRSSDYKSDFAEFWKAWPVVNDSPKGSKSDAGKAFEKAVKDLMRTHGAKDRGQAISWLYTAVKRRRGFPVDGSGIHTKHVCRWLSKKGYEDDEPQKQTGSQGSDTAELFRAIEQEEREAGRL